MLPIMRVEVEETDINTHSATTIGYFMLVFLLKYSLKLHKIMSV